MSKIDVQEIANKLMDLRQPFDTDEIASLINSRFNGRQVKLENLANEIISLVSELIGETRKQDHELMIDLIQSVVDEIQKHD